jgi:type II secretion system protein N
MKIPPWLVRPRLLYGAFSVVAFALALRWTFPSEAVRERLIYEAGARGWQVDVRDVAPSGMLGVRMVGVALTDASGLKIPVEKLDASLQVLPLFLGRRVLDWQASLYEGTVEGSAALSGQDRGVELDIDGVDLSRALPLRRAAGMEIGGKLTGHLELTLPGGSLEKSSGTAQLSVARAALGGGPVPVPPLGNITLPPVALGNLTATAKVEQGRLAVQKLEAAGGDAELSGDGIAVVLQPRMQFAPLTGQGRIRFQATLWQKPSAATLRPVVEAALASSRAPDGSYRFLIAGTLGHPQLRPGTSSGGGPAGPTPAEPPPPPPAGDD